MKTYSKDEMDAMAAEAFSTDTIEENIDLGFDPMDVVTGDPESTAKFKKLHAKAREDQ